MIEFSPASAFTNEPNDESDNDNSESVKISLTNSQVSNIKYKIRQIGIKLLFSSVLQYVVAHCM